MDPKEVNNTTRQTELLERLNRLTGDDMMGSAGAVSVEQPAQIALTIVQRLLGRFSAQLKAAGLTNGGNSAALKSFAVDLCQMEVQSQWLAAQDSGGCAAFHRRGLITLAI